MRKIATPQDVQTELLSIIAYTQGTEKPSRQRIASELRSLADRVAAKIPSTLERLIRMTRNEGHEVVRNEVWVRFKTEADANRFEDRYNAKFDPDSEEDEDLMAYGTLDPKTKLYTVKVPLS